MYISESFRLFGVTVFVLSLRSLEKFVGFPCFCQLRLIVLTIGSLVALWHACFPFGFQTRSVLPFFLWSVTDFLVTRSSFRGLCCLTRFVFAELMSCSASIYLRILSYHVSSLQVWLHLYRDFSSDVFVLGPSLLGWINDAICLSLTADCCFPLLI